MTATPTGKTVRWHGLDFHIGPHTFAPRESSRPVINIAQQHVARLQGPLRLLDVCCGSGALGITLYRKLPSLFESLLCLDASEDAIISCRRNLQAHDIPGSAQVWRAGSDIPPGLPVLALCNPPYLPASDSAPEEAWERTCMYASDQGLQVARRCMESLAGVALLTVLKSAAGQVEALHELVAETFRLDSVQLGPPGAEPQVAFSTWTSTPG